jgi:hypothetical protein
MIPTVMQASVQNVSYTTHAESTAIAANEVLQTRTVRLFATTDCYYLATTAGTAATSSNGSYLPAGIIEYIRVPNNTIISVVQVSSGGSLNITAMSEVTTP